jgi:hypothetical protein
VILWQFALHAWFAVTEGDLDMAGAHATAWLADVLLLGGLAAIVAMAQRQLPAGASRAVEWLGAIVLLLLGAGFALYPQLLRAYLQFPVNVLSTDRRTIGVLVNEYLGLSRLWPALASIAIGLVAARLPVRPLRSRWAPLAFGLVVLAGLISLPRSPHPLVHSIGIQFRRAGERVVPSLLVPPGRTGTGDVATGPAMTLDGPLRADHLFLIVLEGVQSPAFEREFLDAPGGFHAAHRDHAAYYSNYHATNLDSYTSLVAMLTGVQVPYRAYADERLFAAVNEAPSLVRALRDRGAHATFIGTYEHQPFVPVRNQWDDVLDRTNIAGLDRWVSLGTSRMEAASEDRAALATILQAAAAHPRTFILQEMVYGHSTEWRAKTGLGQLAYYDLYLRELFDGLRQRGLDSRSLIIVVSDHGDRALSAVAGNYRVPLLIVGPGVVPGHRSAFLSHQDLPAIVSAELTGTPAPAARAGQLVVGSTERWVYGRIDAGGASLFIDDRTGSVLASAGEVDAVAVFREFQDLVSAFARRFGPVQP